MPHTLSVCRAVALALAIAGAAWSSPSTAVFKATPTLAADPDYRRATAMIEAESFEAALRLLRGLADVYPDEAEVMSLTGFALRKLGRTEEAFPAYFRALELDPEHLGANEYLGELYVTVGNLDRARDQLAVLERVCGRCEEFRELEAAIAAADEKAVPPSAAMTRGRIGARLPRCLRFHRRSGAPRHRQWPSPPAAPSPCSASPQGRSPSAARRRWR
jgi:tetratricopeptide (TPR) repeat protein